jgi:hypothetical protein
MKYNEKGKKIECRIEIEIRREYNLHTCEYICAGCRKYIKEGEIFIRFFNGYTLTHEDYTYYCNEFSCQLKSYKKIRLAERSINRLEDKILTNLLEMVDNLIEGESNES